MATNTFAYNGFGARVSKTDSSGSNTYLRASSGLIGSIVADGGATYTPGVSEKRGATSTFYHSDIKNSVEQTSTGQGVAASKQYDAFGNEVSSSGPWQGPFQYGGAFGYHTDTDYGLKHLGARYYDPTTGRFLSRDPIKDGRNWYAYCGGNPLAHADPTGLIAPAIVAIGGVVLIGALTGAVLGALLAPSGKELTGAGQGAVYGAVGALLFLIAIPVAAYLTGVGVPAWLAGMIGGGVGGFVSQVGVEATGLAAGWDDQFDWDRVAWSAAAGAFGGSLVLRPGNAPSQLVTHYSRNPEGIPQGSWVQIGKPGVQTGLMSGRIGFPYATSASVPRETLSYPSGAEWFKGWLGQRKYLGPSIPPTPFKSPMPFR